MEVHSPNRFSARMANCFSSLLHWVLPNHCYLCGEVSHQFLCPPCEGELPRTAHRCCTCALPLESGTQCGDCMMHPKPFSRTLTAFTYAAPLDYLVNRFKHKRQFNCGDYLGKALAEAVRERHTGDPLPDVLVPVPLHWQRRLRRGFNQAELIAQRLGTTLQLPVSLNSRRLRRNHTQQGLDRKARLRNLRNSFTAADGVRGKHVAIVDDVMTTGATVTELAHCLHQAGATRVDVWVVARVP